MRVFCAWRWTQALQTSTFLTITSGQTAAKPLGKHWRSPWLHTSIALLAYTCSRLHTYTYNYCTVTLGESSNCRTQSSVCYRSTVLRCCCVVMLRLKWLEHQCSNGGFSKSHGPFIVEWADLFLSTKIRWSIEKRCTRRMVELNIVEVLTAACADCRVGKAIVSGWR